MNVGGSPTSPMDPERDREIPTPEGLRQRPPSVRARASTGEGPEKQECYASAAFFGAGAGLRKPSREATSFALPQRQAVLGNSYMKSSAVISALGAFALSVTFAGSGAAQAIQKPDLSVSANDGHFTGYSATLPLDVSTDTEAARLTAKVAGSLENPTYDLDFNLIRKPDAERFGKRSMALGASWNDREARLRSSLSRAFGFGLLPRANYVSVSMDMDASRAIAIPGQIPVARANLRSALTLDGKPVGSIALGGGSMGDEGVDVSFTRPFDIPAEFTVSLRAAATNGGEDWRVQDSRVMVKLVKASW